ncbi:hypothetical protein Tco_0534813 [Tanacetum coccineum]
MAATQADKYAPQCGDLTVESVQFQSNNFVENFSYSQNVPTYKEICKFLMNCPLAEAFTKLPLVLYQTFLRVFWCTDVVEDPNPPEDDFEVHPLTEFIIKFIVKNGKKTLTLDFKTFCESTRLDYNKGNYVVHPSPEAVKAKLVKIATNEALVQKNPVLKTSFLVAWIILLTFVVQVLGGNYSSTKQLNSSQQLLAYCLLIGTKVDLGKIIYSDLVTRLIAKTRQKYVSYPRFVSYALEVLLGSEYDQDLKFGSLPNALMTPLSCYVKKGKKKSQTVDTTKSTRFEVSVPDQNKDKTSSKVESDTETLSLTTVADIQALLEDSDQELKDDSDDDIFKPGEEMDEDIQEPDTKET